MLSMVAASAVFLRWLPHHGWFAGTLVAAAAVTALAINLGRARKLRRSIHGINHGFIQRDTVSVTAVAASVVALSALGIFTVLFLPLAP